MPGELSDPTQLFPFHYDSRYDHKPNPLEGQQDDLDSILQDIAEQTVGHRLNSMDMSRLKEFLGDYLYRHWGDEDFINKVKKSLKTMFSAKKVAQKWRT